MFYVHIIKPSVDLQRKMNIHLSNLSIIISQKLKTL